MRHSERIVVRRQLGTEYDSVALYLFTLAAAESDGLKRQKLTGFLVLSGVTAVEVRLKTFLEEFAASHNPIFAVYVRATLEKTNAKVRLNDLYDYATRFGEDVRDNLKERLKRVDELALRRANTSVKASYENLLTWRNNFAHEGSVTCTFEEARLAIRCACLILRQFELAISG